MTWNVIIMVKMLNLIENNIVSGLVALTNWEMIFYTSLKYLLGKACEIIGCLIKLTKIT